MNQTVAAVSIEDEIRIGLSSYPKYIPSKYFYDDEGSKIFERIMRMPEYYLTDCEYEIFNIHKEKILDLISGKRESFDLVELGAGDGLKTNILIKHFLARNASFKYMPVDISGQALDTLVEKMKTSYPEMVIAGVAGDYFKVLSDLSYCKDCKKVVLFLGSNIGNYSHEESLEFLAQISARLDKGDMLITGFDLVKNPGTILLAYDDPHGYTREFNLNLLRRLNREMNANFDLSGFKHYPFYDAGTASARSFLLSTAKQEVYIEAIGQSFNFEEWEPIQTEMSRKFTLNSISDMAIKSGFRTIRNFFDHRNYFVDALWEKV
jgi:dimethylhistidine N-methyltransferase